MHRKQLTMVGKRSATKSKPQRKIDVVSIRDADPTKSRMISATPGVASIRARTRVKF
jgi:hypothetical protein